MSNTKTVKVSSLNDYKALHDELTRRWLELEHIPNVFRYKLNVCKQKILKGNFNYFVELNTDRTTLRRAPEKITSLVPEFDKNKFNFNKVNAKEILFECIDQLQSSNQIVTYLINNSPLTIYHTLICPNLIGNHSQVLTKDAIKSAIDILYGFNNRNYRIGFNSPGALASVNHLHLQLLHIEHRLYIENANVHHLVGNIFKLNKNAAPANGYSLHVTNYNEKNQISEDLFKLIEHCCNKMMPYNVFWTFGKWTDQEILKIFIFPRKQMSTKFQNVFNVAFCELSGYVPVGNETEYNAITEKQIIENISNEMEEIPNLDQEIISLFS